MATGIPKKRQQDKEMLFANSVSSISSMKLEYLGKKPKSTVLDTTPANVVRLWANPDGHSPNRLFFGDNLKILSTLLLNPEICGNVRLIYIDPPFATQSAFHSRNLDHAYEDTLCGSEYIEFIRERLILLRELLAEDGSIYLHLDEKMVFHIKIIMDEIFGAKNYRNCIIRKKCNPKNYTRKKFGNISDYILFYTKSDNFSWNRPVEAWTEERSKEYQYIEPITGRRFMKVPLHAPGVRNGETGKPWRGMMPPPGKHWQFTPAKLDEMDARGKIYWSTNGNPRRKIYLDENAGIGVQDIWMDFRDAHNQNVRITGYPTEKNPDLLKRIIEASSQPGDLILDCFSGSGTTLAVAASLNRFWIGIDDSPLAIKTILRRFAIGTEPMGDFVSQRNGKKEGISSQSSLFASIESTVKQKGVGIEHQPISNFEFFADATLVESSNDLLSEWKTGYTSGES
ncbi:MAG: site-specific DNA-methyltransferase [Pseudomonadota bacterium]